MRIPLEPLRCFRVGRGVAVALVAAVCGLTASAAWAGGPLRTAIFEPVRFADGARQVGSFRRARATGASMVRLQLVWKNVARVPPGADAANPSNRTYDWASFDRQLRLAVANGFEPYVYVMFAPGWAEGPGNSGEGTHRPDPAAFGQFARAAALRYSGSFAPPGQPVLPRVRYWMAWAEPNRDYFLMPQYEGRRIVSAEWYRRMLSQFAQGVRSANSGNLVIGGALAPIARPGKPAPLAFMRELLCMSRSYRPTCDLRSAPVDFDVWAHHPYTLGGPTHRAGGDNVSLGDLPRMRRLLGAAIRAGHVRSTHPVQFWATEISWDTRPPDPGGVPSALHARWTAEALYRLWQNGVSVATWWRLQDDPFPEARYQSGFFTVDGRPKRSLTAFRFPVVAFARRGVYVWGRTPTSRPGRVAVELNAGRGWRRVGVLRANGFGIFARTFGVRARSGAVRARFGATRSIPFSLKRPRDRRVDPMGCGAGAC